MRIRLLLLALLICASGAVYAQNGSNYIIQNTSGYPADVRQFEADCVQAYLTLHNLPSTDSALLYEYGREDLRTELRSFMYTSLGVIISTPAASRTTHQQNIYNWFEALVYQNEVTEYRYATSEFQKFLSNKCGYQLDSTVATAYNLKYNGGPFCFPDPLIDLFFDPPTPSPDYYLAVGIENSYNAPLNNDPKNAVILAQTKLLFEANLAYAVIPGAAAAGTTAALYATATLAPFAFRGFVGGAAAVTDALDIGLATTAEAAGPLVIIGITAAIAIQAGMQVVQQDQQMAQLAQQQSYYNNLVANCNSVDLNGFLNDATNAGGYKLLATWTAATLPDVPSTAALPTRTEGVDPVFGPPYPNPPTYNSLHYTDWTGIEWTVSFWGNYFIQYQTKNPSVTSFTPTLEVDEKGDGTILYTASRVGPNFLITPQTPASNAEPCPASATTGLSAAGSSLSNCSSYVASYITFTDPSIGQNSAYAPLSNPTFQTNGSVTFTDGTPQTIRLQAALSNVNFSGDTAYYQLTGTLPPHITQTTNAEQISISYDGAAIESLPGTYNTSLSATFGSNGGGSSPDVSGTQPFVIVVKAGDAIITQSQTLNAYVGDSVNYQITTAGHPGPVITLSGITLPAGLKFTNYGNGTASISGVATAPGTSSGMIETDYGATQPLQVTVTYRTSPAFTSANTWTFNDNVAGTFSIATSGSSPTALRNPIEGQASSGVPAIFAASLPFSSGFVGTVTPNRALQHPFSNAPWLSFQDNGNGTATIAGTPPSGTVTTTINLESVYTNSLPSRQQLTLVATSAPAVITPDNPAEIVVVTYATPIAVPVQVVNVPETMINIGSALSGPTLTISNGILNLPSLTTSGLIPLNLSIPVSGSQCFTSAANEKQSRAPVSATPAVTAAASTGPMQLLQTLYVEVDQAPAITSASSVNFFQGISNNFAVTTSGFPESETVPNSPSSAQAMRVTLTGTLPAGLSFTDLNLVGLPTGTGILSGTPTTGGTFPLTFTANNGVGTPAAQNFTLVIKLPGDVNGDGVVNCLDVAEVNAAFGLYQGQTGYDPLADVNHDGVVNILDLTAVSYYLPAGTRCR